MCLGDILSSDILSREDSIFISSVSTAPNTCTTILKHHRQLQNNYQPPAWDIMSRYNEEDLEFEERIQSQLERKRTRRLAKEYRQNNMKKKLGPEDMQKLDIPQSRSSEMGKRSFSGVQERKGLEKNVNLESIEQTEMEGEARISIAMTTGKREKDHRGNEKGTQKAGESAEGELKDTLEKDTPNAKMAKKERRRAKRELEGRKSRETRAQEKKAMNARIKEIFEAMMEARAADRKGNSGKARGSASGSAETRKPDRSRKGKGKERKMLKDTESNTSSMASKAESSDPKKPSCQFSGPGRKPWCKLTTTQRIEKIGNDSMGRFYFVGDINLGPVYASIVDLSSSNEVLSILLAWLRSDVVMAVPVHEFGNTIVAHSWQLIENVLEDDEAKLGEVKTENKYQEVFYPRIKCWQDLQIKKGNLYTDVQKLWGSDWRDQCIKQAKDVRRRIHWTEGVAHKFKILAIHAMERGMGREESWGSILRRTAIKGNDIATVTASDIAEGTKAIVNRYLTP